jgi:hypothetical protein
LSSPTFELSSGNVKNIAMKRFSLFILICCFIASCQQDVTGAFQRRENTRDSLVGRWNYIYTFFHVFSDSNFTIRTDSIYDGYFVPYSFLELKADSTWRWFRSENRMPPIYGIGYSGKWGVDPAKREIQTTMQLVSTDTGWLNTNPYPGPMEPGSLGFIKYLGNDSLVLYFRGKWTPFYRGIYDVYTR